MRDVICDTISQGVHNVQQGTRLVELNAFLPSDEEKEQRTREQRDQTRKTTTTNPSENFTVSKAVVEDEQHDEELTSLEDKSCWRHNRLDDKRW